MYNTSYGLGQRKLDIESKALNQCEKYTAKDD